MESDQNRRNGWPGCPRYVTPEKQFACYSPDVMTHQFMILIDSLRAFHTVIGYDRVAV